MRVTSFEPDGDTVRVDVTAAPPWRPFDTWQGQPLSGVERVDLVTLPRAQLQQVRLRAGGHFVMHTSPDLAFCQVVTGRGVLRLPDGVRIPYQGPELYLFWPGSLHEWTDIEADTLLSVCLLHRPNHD